MAAPFYTMTTDGRKISHPLSFCHDWRTEGNSMHWNRSSMLFDRQLGLPSPVSDSLDKGQEERNRQQGHQDYGQLPKHVPL